MFTMEQKVDLVMRYVTTVDQNKRLELKRKLIAALKEYDVSETTDYDTEVERISNDIIFKLGVPPHIKGHNYILAAMKKCANDPSYLDGLMTKCLYPDIAKDFDTTPSRVERCMRSAIESIFNKGNADQLVDIFGNIVPVGKGYISNSEFIAASVKKIHAELKERGIAKEKEV